MSSDEMLSDPDVQVKALEIKDVQVVIPLELPDVRWVSICYMLLFMSFLPCQNLVTSRFGSTGYTALAILYASFCAFNTLAPSIVNRLGAKTAMVVGSSGYTLFNLACATAVSFPSFEPSLYPASLIVGCCAAILWTAQGSYVSAVAPEVRHAAPLCKSFTITRIRSMSWYLFICSNILTSISNLLGFSKLHSQHVHYHI